MSRKRDRTQPVNWSAPEDVGVDKMTLLQIERDTALADAKYDRKTAQDLRAEIDGLERERDASRKALTIANEDARKLAIGLEGESNLVAELSRRLAALEAKP